MHRLHKKFGRLAVWIMTFSTTGLSPLSQETLSQKERLGETLLYLRFHRLQAESSAEILHAIESSAFPELKGLILDWRYCQDDAFEAIPPLLALFVSEAVSLPKMGLDVESVTPAPSRVEIPTVVLVNEGTKGSPEVMAALLKQGRHAVLVGRTTAGRAVVRDVVPLSTGQKLLPRVLLWIRRAFR